MLPSVYFVTSSIILFGYVVLNVNVDFSSIHLSRLSFAVIATFLIAVRGIKNKSLDESGALAGVFVGLLLTISNLGFFSCLLVFFLLGSKATRYKSSVKYAFEADFKVGGQRDWVQVLCNGGIPSQLALIYLNLFGIGELAVDFSKGENFLINSLAIGVVSSLACCLGDTLASELGSVYGSRCPRLITTGQIVPRGTNGAVSPHGFLFSFIGGFLVGLSYCVALWFLTPTPIWSSPTLQIIFGASVAGLLGSLIDSILGATLQFSGISKTSGKIVEAPGPEVQHISGMYLLSNHTVNLLSVIITSLSVPLFLNIIWGF